MVDLIISINRRLVNKSTDPRYIRDVSCWKFKLLDLPEFKEYVVQRGFAFLPGRIDPWATGNYTASDVNETNVLCVDIDKDLSIDVALKNKFVKKHCFFAYTTFSHTSARHRYRLLFKLEDSIRGSTNIKGAIAYLVDTYFPKADKNCVDAGRLYFGNSAAEILIENAEAKPLGVEFIKPAIAYATEIEYARHTEVLLDDDDENIDYEIVKSAYLPRDWELIWSQLSYIPPRSKGENTYLACRDAMWALCGALGREEAIFIMSEHSPSEGDWSLEKIAADYNPKKMRPSKCLGVLRSLASQHGWIPAYSRQPNIIKGRLSERQQLLKLKLTHEVPVEEVALDRLEKQALQTGCPEDKAERVAEEQVLEIAMNLIDGFKLLHEAGFKVVGDTGAWKNLVVEKDVARLEETLKESQESGRSPVSDNEAWGNTSNAVARAEKYLLSYVPKDLPIVKDEGYRFETCAPETKISVLAEEGDTVDRIAKKCLGAIFNSSNPWHHIYRYGSAKENVLCFPVSDGKAVGLKHVYDKYVLHSFLNDRLDYSKIVSRFVKGECVKEPKRQIEVDPKVLAYFMGSINGNIPFVRGIRTVPALNKRYEVVSVGYDPETKFLYDYEKRDFNLENKYTREDARDAFDFVLDLLDEFQFENNAHRSAYFSYLLTCVTRNMYAIAPIFMITSGTSGSGKSYLSKIGAAIADGLTEAKSYVKDQDEFRKTLHYLFGSERSVVILDNANDEIMFTNSDLETLITEGNLEIRVLGTNKAICYPYVQTLAINGNNTAPSNDFVRRTLPIKINKRADRNFKYPELVDRALSMRADLLKALLIIVLAYHQSGETIKSEFDVAFRAWWNVTCAPLVWLGEVDPMRANQQAVDDDLYIMELDAWFDGIEELMGVDTWWSLSELMQAARNQNNGLDPLDWTPLWLALREKATSRYSSELSVKTLGKYFNGHMVHKQDKKCTRSFKSRMAKNVRLYSLVKNT